MFTDKDGDGTIEQGAGEVLQENHYYPSTRRWVKGPADESRMDGRWQNDASVADNAYQYNGKELNEDFGLEWLDYGARWYDPAVVPERSRRVGRWGAVDPLTGDYESWSPFNYVLGNPISLVDPDGMGVTGDYFGSNGKYLGNDGVDDDKVHIVTDKSESKALKKELKIARKNGQSLEAVLTASSLSSTVTINTSIVEGVIGSIKAMKTETSKGAGDAGLHEEGGHYANGIMTNWKSGPKKDGSKENASIDLFNGVDRPDVASLEAYWHVHTDKSTETGETDAYGNPQTLTGASGPSPGDKSAHKKLVDNGYSAIAIVAGGKRGQVHFYNGNGSYFKTSLKRFSKMSQ